VTRTSFDLSGRSAVITGGAQGFGRAIAERFLASGARVSLWDVNPELNAETARELGGAPGVHTATVDVSVREEVEAAAKATATALGGIHILVANA
jgi:3-oxoacyl-[acyl-carrier protein] reductase